MDDKASNDIRDRFEAVEGRVEQAAQRAGRKRDEIKLVVVTKSKSIDEVRAVVAAGARYLGENYPEESESKILQLRADGAQVEWHMIGHLQSRKARLVTRYFDCMHSLDSLALAQRMERMLSEEDRVLPVFLELNLGGEDSKYGWRTEDSASNAKFFGDLEQIMDLPHLRLEGIMLMPPWFDDPEDARPYFQDARRVQEELAKKYPAVNWLELSMGTSLDFEVAIEEGATMVRVGQAILGSRVKPVSL